ncbi:ABC transporter substrate-binding protein [Paenibacillus frigoriresistens]|uniref:ABC transporter substrate-binding protein n=1 Tax=Paenibacillus alginolyticus TaxID=59839 RepID=UPI0015636FC1|nr:ABC transporter substrate-binding protein [Paenibacillus frigoriresistens]NRF94639.1 ABC transporter substrate-binding protein [Paenibacillus frigoriresistens]
MISLSPTDYGVPDYYELVLAASEQGIQDKQALYAKFIKAITAGQKFVQQNPDKALSILFEHEDKTAPLDKDIETKSLQVLLPLMDAKDKDFGYQDPKVWENVSVWLKDTKLLPAAVKAEEAFTNF